MPTQFVYFPINSRKDKRSSVYRSSFAPTTGRANSYETDTKYAPKIFLRAKNTSESLYEYNPDYRNSFYYDYAPSNFFSQKFKERFAPSTSLVYFNRYSPFDENELHYEPKMFSRFKPQIVVISNYDALDSYYNYIVKLLKTLR